MIECICSFEEEYGFLKSETMSVISELIRCKDCKHWKNNIDADEFTTCRMYGVQHGMLFGAWDFCSRAERKEE